MTTIPTMLQDDRPIDAILYNDADGSCYRVGQLGCTKITAYGEGGMACDIPFIAVHHGGEIKHRIPAYMVQIVYADTKGER